MLCPSCRKLISVSAERCPFCGAARPGLWGLGPRLGGILQGRTDPVALIPAICIALYVLALLLDPRALFGFSRPLFGLLAPSGRVLARLGSTQPFDLVVGHYSTLLSAIYLHGSLLHILFNMLWVRSLAPEVRSAFGPARFFVIWTIAGVSGFLLSNLLPLFGFGANHVSVGASGSIFGLLAALIVYGRTVGASLMARRIWQWAILLGIMGFLMPGVDNLAHGGGFAGGYLAASLYRASLGRPEGRGTTFFALGLLAFTGVVLVRNALGAALGILAG